PAAMLARLDKRLPLLTGGARDLPRRQRALRETIAWSYDLLTPEEQALFRRLSYFSGGMTLDAAEYVGPPEGMLDTVGGLERLVEHSLLQIANHPDDQSRFRMLETIREFGLERLHENREGDTTSARHLGYFLDLAELAASELEGPRPGPWLDRLEVEHDNLGLALAWAIDLPDGAVARRLAAALWPFWNTRGHFSEGLAWLERVLARDGDEPKPAYAAVLTGAGSIARMQGDLGRATELLEQALAIRRELADRVGVANVLMVLGHVAERQGDLGGAGASFEDALAIGREIDEPSLVGAALINLGIVADQQGAHERAVARYEDALAIFRRLGDRRHESIALDNLGIATQSQGDLAQAARYYEAALAISRDLGDAWGIAGTLGNLGIVAQSRGDLERARAVFEESLAGFRTLGDPRGMANALGNLGDVARSTGDLAHAAALHHEALTLARDLDDRIGVAFGLEGIAAVLAAAGTHDRAIELLGAADALRAAVGAPLPPENRPDRDRVIAGARAALDDARFSSCWEAGSALPWGEAVAGALHRAGETAREPASR
ncbi:MAG: ATP-binding protein, partial [Thermomicrobiales bacterium]